jgi:hypothetical protein
MPASVARHVNVVRVKIHPEPPEPWFRPNPQVAAALVREARAEIGTDHELAGHQLTAIAEVARAGAEKTCEAEHGPAHDTFDREAS